MTAAEMCSDTSDPLSSVFDRIADWASTKPMILRVYIFGSRVKGTAKSNSDLDIAIEFATEDPGYTLAWWFEHHESWEKEIQLLVPFAPHLQILERTSKSAVNEYLKSGSVLVFEQRRES